jgi:hypothetical protein
MFPIVLQDGDTFLQEPIGSDVPALPWPPPLTDTELVRPEAGLARIGQKPDVGGPGLAEAGPAAEAVSRSQA